MVLQGDSNVDRNEVERLRASGAVHRVPMTHEVVPAFDEQRVAGELGANAHAAIPSELGRGFREGAVRSPEDVPRSREVASAKIVEADAADGIEVRRGRIAERPLEFRPACSVIPAV